MSYIYQTYGREQSRVGGQEACVFVCVCVCAEQSRKIPVRK